LVYQANLGGCSCAYKKISTKIIKKLKPPRGGFFVKEKEMAQQSTEREMTYNQELCHIAARRIKAIRLGRLAVNKLDLNALKLAADLQESTHVFGDEIEVDYGFASDNETLEEAGQGTAIAIIPVETSDEELTQLRCGRLVNHIGPISFDRREVVGFSLVASLEKICGDA
jgi:hypothetical protein